MKLYQNTNKHTWYNGWYGECGSECQNIDLTQSEYENISTVYEFTNDGTTYKKFVGNTHDFLNDFDELVCGKVYLILLKPGNSFVEIPNFTTSVYEQQTSSGYIDKTCDDEVTVNPITDDKIKILALHGGGENSSTFQNQAGMIDLMSEFPNIEFVFADAPSNNVWMQDPPYGKNYPTTDSDWADDSISYLDSLVEQHGSFFGILGYSQGAAFIPVYLSKTSNNFELALMYNGYLPETHQGLIASINSSAPFSVPAVVFSGEYDYSFKDMAPDLYSKFSDAIYVRSSVAGHHLPTSSDSKFEEIKNYILSITNNT